MTNIRHYHRQMLRTITEILERIILVVAVLLNQYQYLFHPGRFRF